MGDRILNVGLTGGIGSGKSVVSQVLADRGAIVIDSDVLAREAVVPGSSGLAEVVAEFGDSVLAPDGGLDRGALAAIVFADPARREALERIVHPYVRTRSAQIAAAAPPGSVVVHDVPLLVENRLQDMYDVVVVVDAPTEAQVERLVRIRGMAEADARSRIAAQATREQRRAIADHVIDNCGTLDDLAAKVEDLWARLMARRGG